MKSSPLNFMKTFSLKMSFIKHLAPLNGLPILMLKRQYDVAEKPAEINLKGKKEVTFYSIK